jgi:hypothetical protein
MIIVIALLAACQGPVSDTPGEEDASQDAPMPDMANPAAVYCDGLGYKMESVERDGGQDADCIFPDGQRCGQWDFLSGRCGQEHTFCLQNEGMRFEEGANIGTCIFEDGSTCDEYAYYLGQCQPGANPAQESLDDRESPQADQPEATSGVPVVGWMGYVISTPAGAQFDDYVIVLPEGEVGEFGIQGASQDVQELIVALRDHEPPGKYAHFWGTLTCDVIDYGGCQLLVDRLRVDGPGEFFAPDTVEGWQGTIISFSYDEPGAPHPDDAFILAGDYPVQYGIDSAISADSGERDLSGVIADLRDGAGVLRIWGQMICGVPDAGGCHIEVYRIEAGDQDYKIAPAW